MRKVKGPETVAGEEKGWKERKNGIIDINRGSRRDNNRLKGEEKARRRHR